MVDASKRLKFPMLAGSSLPVTWRLPDIEIPLGSEIESAVAVGNGGSDIMDYHGMEAMQCMLERRKGGETGVRAVRMVEGDDVWKLIDDGHDFEGIAGVGAVAERLAAGTDDRRRPHAGSGRQGTTAEAGGEAGGVSDRISRRPARHAADAERRDQGLQRSPRA